MQNKCIYFWAFYCKEFYRVFFQKICKAIKSPNLTEMNELSWARKVDEFELDNSEEKKQDQ